MKTREKVILYLLPFLLLLLIYLNKEILFIDDTISIDKKVLESKTKITKGSQKLSNIAILEFYEQLAKKNKVKIDSISFKKKKLFFSSIGKLNNSIAFLYSIEQINKIEQFQFYYESNKLRIEFSIDTSFVDINKPLENNIFSIENPYIVKKDKIDKDQQTVAIFDKYIFYDGKWLGVGADYKDKKIVNISRNFIELRDKNGSILMEKINAQ